MFFPPIPLIRKKHIVKKLSDCGATTPATAVSFEKAGIINPNGFSAVTTRLLNSRVIGKTSDGRFYVL